MEVEIPNTDIEIVDSADIEVITNVDVLSNVSNDLEITFDDNEYSIVGDDMVVMTNYDDAPQWLKDTIGNIVNIKTAIAIGDLDATKEALDVMLSELEVAKNTYELSIISSEDIDERITTAITTLNSSLREADATILQIAQTAVTPEEATAISINTLSASLSSNGTIGSAIHQLNVAMSTLENTTAESLSYLSSTMEGEINGNAKAMQTIRTYVGIDENGKNTGIGLLTDVEILQKQNDGIIETVTGTYDVMLGIEDPNTNTDNDQLDVTKEPYASWLAEDVANGNIAKRSAHVGDVYIKYSNSDSGYKSYEKAYKFIRTVVDASDAHKSTDSEGFTWSLIVDTDAQNAYVAALNAYDLADDKRRIFVGLGATSTPSIPYDQGDLWLIDAARVVNGYSCKVGDILRCVETKGKIGVYEQNDWVLASSYANAVDAQNQQFLNFVNNDYAGFVTSIQSQVDKKAETFYQNSIPTGRIKSINVPNNVTLNTYVGDLWKNTYAGTISGYLGNNTEYIYTKTANGSNWNYDWVKMEVPDIVFDTIDTKKSIYSGNSVPVAVYPDVIEVNDMWITGSSPTAGYDKESVYIWSGSSWVKPLKYTDDTQVVALQTGLANGTTTIKLTNAYVGSVPLTTYLSNEIDGKVGVYSGETAPVNGQPSGVAVNDIYLWFTTASKVLANGTTQVYDITRTYKYSGTVWNEITTDSNIVSLADLADGKRTIFSGNTVPVGSVDRDIWIPSADVSITTSAMCSVANGTWNGTSCSVSKYYQGEVYQFSATGKWIVATKYTANLEAVRTNLQGQLDGKVETYYQATVPTGMTALNNGDYWYCTADVSTYKKGKVYKYVHATTSWVETADVSRYAFEVADGKAAIFSSANLPTSGYNINDMLIVVGSFNNGTTTFADGVVLSSNADRTSGFTPADWVKKINDTEDLDAFVSGTYTPAVASLQNQIDGQISYYFFDSSLGQSAASVSGSSSWTTDALKKEHNGDIAYDTKLELGYWYNRSVSNWVQVTGAQNAGVIEALKKAAEAKEAADNVIVSYYAWKQTTAPATQYKWMKDDNTLWEYVGSTWVVVDVKKDDTLTAYNNTTKDTTLYVHNGSVWAMITPNGIVANAKAVTDLNASLSSLGTTVSGHTSLLNTVDTRIGAEGARVETRFAYNSTVNIGGIYKKSGFGLTTNYASGSGTLADPYVSEFWIDASRFKFTNSNVTGSVAPFTIEASGPQPQVTFNGKVTFGSGQTGTIDEAIAAVVETVAVGDKNINITDNLIPITSLVADTDNSGYQFIGTPTKSNTSGIDTYAEAQIVLDGNDEVYSPYVDDTTISYYYRFGIKGITSGSVFKIVTINSSNVATSNTITITMNSGQSIVAGNWYIIEGIINPTGGSSAAVGSIRNSSGIKIGTVSSFVMPIGTNKLVLGWVANCTISRIKLCKVTADTVTSDLTTVNSQLGALQTDINNISWSSLQGKDLMAQQLGYNNYSELAAATTNGKTVINGGYLNTGLINVGGINANQINTVGLIAENINASEIVGKTITGGTIVGASITGVTIKASYLDLDGELEVLTNFYLCVNGNTTGVPAEAIAEGRYRTYNASLDIDAVPSTTYTNIYRIPTLSTVREPDKEVYLNGIGNYSTTYVRSYNTANAGHNSKCVKPRPYIYYSAEILRLSAPGYYSIQYYNLEVSHTVAVYCLGDLVGTFASFSEKQTWSGSNGDESSLVYGAIVNGVRMNTFSKIVNGILFRLDVVGNVPNTAVVTITAICVNQYLTKNFIADDIIKVVVTANPTGYWSSNSSAVFKTSSTMTINNMV